jgi:hypothetical protein
VVHVVSKESRRLVLPRLSVFSVFFYNNNNNYLTGMLIWLPYRAVAILPMPYLGWKSFTYRIDKDNNITRETMNAVQRYGRNTWAMASYNLTVIQGLWSGTEILYKDKQWLHAYAQTVHS